MGLDKEDKDGTEKNNDFFSLAVHNGDRDSFPVLNAFREYIEAERERSRRRQTQTVIGFLSAMLVMTLMFFAAASFFMSKFWNQGNEQMSMMLSILAEKSRPGDPVAERAATTGTDASGKMEEVLSMLRRMESRTAALEIAVTGTAAAVSSVPSDQEKDSAAAAASGQPEAANASPAGSGGVKGAAAPLRGIIVNGQKYHAGSLNREKPATDAGTAPSQSQEPSSQNEAGAAEAVARQTLSGVADGSIPAEDAALESPAESASEESSDTAPAVEVTFFKSETLPAAPDAAEPTPDSGSWEPVVIRPRKAKKNIVPDGFLQEDMSVVNEDMISIPWRVLIPSGE